MSFSTMDTYNRTECLLSFASSGLVGTSFSPRLPVLHLTSSIFLLRIQGVLTVVESLLFDDATTRNTYVTIRCRL